METVSIRIPSALYTEIYAKFGEDAGSRIIDSLRELLESTPSDGHSERGAKSRYSRPSSGTITGRVWEIADKLKQESGEATRNAVVKACISEGINLNTANTQYSHWRNHST